VLDHLGPLRRLLPPATPRPPDPALSLAHPQNHLPPAPAARQAASPQAPHRAPQAPRPAKGVHSCPEARTAPLPSDETPLLTWHDLGTGLWTGLRRVYDFRRGTQQASEDMVNPLKIYQAAHGLGDQLATLVPGADGQKAAPGTLARSMGHGFIDGINPFNKKSAYDTGQATANAASVIVPGLGEAGALNDLRLGLRAANLGRAAAEAGLRAAEGTPGEAAAVARLKAAEEQVAQARAALRGKIPGAGARRAVRQAGEKAQRARAAVAKYRERKAAGGRDPHDPWAKHTDESRLKGQKAAAGLRGKWHGGAPGQGAGQGQPAPAHATAGGGGGGGATTHPIGRLGVMKMESGELSEIGTGGAAHHRGLPEPNAEPFAQRLSSEEVPKDPTLRRQMLVKETAQTRANARVLRGLKGGKPTGGCVGVARTDIKGLQNRVFEGGSRYAGDKPDTTFIHGDGSIDRAQAHAEQNLAGEFDRAIKEEMAAGRLTPADIKGKNVYMHTELPTCNSCKWGKNTPDAPDAKLGVPMKLSKKYPDVTFTYTSDEAPDEVLVIKNGIATSD